MTVGSTKGPGNSALGLGAALNPYAIGVPGAYLGFVATPPGAGAHGMCGYNAAQAALARLDRCEGCCVPGRSAR